MDTIKTRRQAGVPSGLKDILFNPLSSLRSFYRGYGVAILLSTPATSIYLSTYEFAKQNLSTYAKLSTDSTLVHPLSGAFAEMAAGCVFTPMEVIKARMQVFSQTTPQTGRMIFKQILKENNIQGLFRGYLLGFSVFGPYSVAYFVSYEKLKSLFTSSDETSLHGYKIWMASSISVAIAATISNPMDVVKVRWQLHSPTFSSRSISELVKKLATSEKSMIMPFFRGSLTRVIWLVPSTSITFTIFELLKEHRIP